MLNIATYAVLGILVVMCIVLFVRGEVLNSASVATSAEPDMGSNYRYVIHRIWRGDEVVELSYDIIGCLELEQLYDENLITYMRNNLVYTHDSQ